MKRVKTIIADNGKIRIEIVVKITKQASWDKENVEESMDYEFDKIINAVATGFHYSDIKIK